MQFRRIEADMKRPQCAECHKAIKPGQVGAFQKLGPQHPITGRVIWWHGNCLRTLALDCPIDNDLQAFNDLRDRIAVTGMAFPD